MSVLCAFATSVVLALSCLTHQPCGWVFSACGCVVFSSFPHHWIGAFRLVLRWFFLYASLRLVWRWFFSVHIFYVLFEFPSRQNVDSALCSDRLAFSAVLT